MGLIELIIVIALVGLFVWAIGAMFGDKIGPQFMKMIYVVAVVFMVLYILSAFGLLHGFHDIRIGR